MKSNEIVELRYVRESQGEENLIQGVEGVERWRGGPVLTMGMKDCETENWTMKKNGRMELSCEQGFTSRFSEWGRVWP